VEGKICYKYVSYHTTEAGEERAPNRPLQLNKTGHCRIEALLQARKRQSDATTSPNTITSLETILLRGKSAFPETGSFTGTIAFLDVTAIVEATAFFDTPTLPETTEFWDTAILLDTPISPDRTGLPHRTITSFRGIFHERA
jgi:hypothetical protein